MKNTSLVWLSALAVLFAGPLIAETPERSEGELPENVILAVRTASLKEVSDRVMEAARRIEPGPQTEMLPFMLGAMIGDPTFEGLEAGENIGFALVRQTDGLVPVVMGKLTGDSPYRESLAGYDMEVSDFEDWTFATQAPATPDDLGDLRGALLSWVRESRERLVELEADGPGLAQLLRENEARIRAGIEELDESEEFGGIFSNLVEVVAGELETVVSMGLALDLDSEKVGQYAHLVAGDGTPLAALLAADHTASTGVAEWIAEDSPMIFLGGLDFSALNTYWTHLMSGLNAGGNDTVREFLEPLETLAELYGETGHSSSVTAFRMSGMEHEMFTVSDIGMDEETLLQSLHTTARLMSHMEGAGNGASAFGEVRTVTSLDETRETVGDHPVHVLRTRVDWDATEMEVPEGERAFYEAMYDQSIYYAHIEGFLITGSDRERFMEGAGRLLSGEKPEPNATSLFREESGLAYQLVLKPQFFMGTVEAFLPPEAMEGVAALPHATGEARIEGGGARGHFEMPIATIAGIYTHFQGMMQAPPDGGFEFDMDENGDSIE